MTPARDPNQPALPIGVATPDELRGSFGTCEEPREITWWDGPVAAPPRRWDAAAAGE